MVTARSFVLVLQAIAAAGQVKDSKDGSGGEHHETHGVHWFFLNNADR
jgi:hypothetical protein